MPPQFLKGTHNFLEFVQIIEIIHISGARTKVVALLSVRTLHKIYIHLL